MAVNPEGLRIKIGGVTKGSKTLTLEEATRLAAKGLSTKTETYRKYFEEVTYPVLLKFADFQAAIDDGIDEQKVKDCIEKLDTLDSNAKARGEPGVNAATAIAAYQTLLRDVEYDVGHKDYSVIVQNLTAIKEFFKLGIAYFNANPEITDTDLKPGRIKSQTGDYAENPGTATVTATKRDLKEAIKELNKAIVLGVSLQKLHAAQFDDEGTPIEDVLQDLRQFLTDPVEVTAAKTKDVDVLTGKGNFKLEIQESEFNRNARGKFESYLTQTRSRIAAGNFSKGADKIFNEMGLSAAEITALEGSRSLDEGIVTQLADIAGNKKPKKYRAKGKATARAKVKKPSSIPMIRPVKRRVFNKPLVLKRSGKKQESSSDADSRKINKLRLQINRRLPAEVRRNMGRPALENQTGRFSNSVELSELRQGPKTLIGEYRYLFAPYETFENTGVYRWPTGYNPKPLITKSIRNLAAQYTEQKFTLRRE